METHTNFKGSIEEFEKLAMEFRFDWLPDELKNNWKAAVKTYPGKPPFFLEDNFIDDMMEKFSFISEFKDMFKKAAELARNDENISMIAWLWYYTCYVALDWRNIYSWPNLACELGEYENMIPILVLFAGNNRMLDFYEQRNIPEEVKASNYYGIETSFDWFKRMYKNNGVGNNVLAWAVRYFGSTLFYLGRLQYELINCRNNIRVYRNCKTDEVICLAEECQVFREDGQYDGTNGIKDEKNAWTSEYKECNRFRYGSPISPESYAISRKIALNKEEWQLVLKRGDPVLNIHIPGKGKLNYDAVKESFLKTVPFFNTYFPEYKWEALICNSWLLDTQLRQFLKSSSNIVKFQDSFYLFPVYSSDSTGVYRFLFQTNVCKPENLPVNSSLQKSVREYLIGGSKIKIGGGFILRKDLDRSQGYYRDVFNKLIHKA